MGVVEELSKEYQQEIDRLRQDNAVQCGDFARLAAETEILRQENEHLLAGHRKFLARPEQQQIRYLQMDNLALHRQLGESTARADALQQDNDRLRAENIALHQRLLELTEHRASADESPAVIVKPSRPDKPRSKPGRPAGHAAALRPAPKRGMRDSHEWRLLKRTHVLEHS